MQSYTEAQLQAYVETHLERNFRSWCGIYGQFAPCNDVRIIGSQVPCASGIIDILATVNHIPTVIELKAVTATEKVIGQVSRYKEAVRETFAMLCLDIGMGMDLHSSMLHGEEQVMCVIIAPGYDRASLHSIGYMGWPLVATMNHAGGFDIAAHGHKRQHEFGYGSPEVRRLLENTATEFIGANIGRAWNRNYERERNKIESPWSYYHISEA